MDYLLKHNDHLRDVAENYGYSGCYDSLPEPIRRYMFYLAIAYTNKNASIAIDDMTCLYRPLSKVAAERIAKYTENLYLISTYDETVLVSLIEKSPANDLNVYVVDKGSVKRADPEKILDLSCDVYFNLERILLEGDG